MSVLEKILNGSAPELARFNVDQLHRMIELGVLSEGTPIELIDGFLVRKDSGDTGGDRMIHGPRHASAIKRWQRLASKVEGTGYHLLSQLPITLDDDVEPEPDGAIVRGTLEDYMHRHPRGGDVVLVCEIADSSLDYDRTIKLAAYSRALISTYWIVNLRDYCVEVYTSPEPQSGRYANRVDAARGGVLRLEVAHGCAIDIAVDELLS